jgi:hypothetical protein
LPFISHKEVICLSLSLLAEVRKQAPFSFSLSASSSFLSSDCHGPSAELLVTVHGVELLLAQWRSSAARADCSGTSIASRGIPNRTAGTGTLLGRAPRVEALATRWDFWSPSTDAGRTVGLWPHDGTWEEGPTRCGDALPATRWDSRSQSIDWTSDGLRWSLALRRHSAQARVRVSDVASNYEL